MTAIFWKKVLFSRLILIFNRLFMELNKCFLSRRTVLWGVMAALAVLLACGVWGYHLLEAPNFMPEKTAYVYIDEATDFDGLCRQLRDSAGCRRIERFRRLAGWTGYPSAMRTGRYAVRPGMGNWDLLNDLRRGHQAATRVTFNNIRLKEELAERLAGQLMFGKEELLTLLGDSAYCDSLGFSTAISLGSSVAGMSSISAVVGIQA